MTDLEERIRTNLHATGIRLPDAAPGVTFRRQHRPSRLRGPVIGVAALLAVLVMIGAPLWLAGRESTEVPAATSPVTVVSGPDNPSPGLLFAPENAFVVDTQVSAATTPRADGGWAAGLVESPTGTTYRLSARPSGDERWPSADARVVDDHTFVREDDTDNAVTGYVYADACVTVVLLSPAEEAPWNDEALALLGAVDIDGRGVDVELPAGWQDHGAGSYGPLYQVSFEVLVDDTRRLVSLRQMPGSPVAALPALASGPLTRTTVEGGPAWMRRRPGGPAALVWNEGGVAVMLEADGLTAEQLRDLAPTLRRGATARWASVPVTDIADATLPPDRPSPLTNTCGPTRLTVT